ncbi:MAG TPA: hypothetical protein VIU12_31515 [Chryseolinea sp.]
MKSYVIFFLIVISKISYAQPQSRLLEVYSITEYSDGYVFKTIDKVNFDTLNIVSPKESLKSRKGLEKICVGGKYDFEFEDRISQMAAVPSGSFVVRIKTTLLWKAGDPMKERPIFARNTKDIFIKKK